MPISIDTEELVLAFLGVPALTAAVGYVLKAYTDNRIKAGFTAEEQRRKASYDAELERVKADLGREADRLRHEQQRRLQASELYAPKRQEVYAEVYALYTELVAGLHRIVEANDAGLRGYGSLSDVIAAAREVGATVEEVTSVTDQFPRPTEGAVFMQANGLLYSKLLGRQVTVRQQIETLERVNALYISAAVEAAAAKVTNATLAFFDDPGPDAAFGADGHLRDLQRVMHGELSGN